MKNHNWWGRNHQYKTFAILLAAGVFCCGRHPNSNYDTLFKISYSRVQGFSSQKGPVIEWDSASANNEDEPRVAGSSVRPLGLRIRWLGVAGYEISDDSTVILIDPFVSRPTFVQLLNTIKIDTSAVKHYILAPLQMQNVKVVLISHAHHDHLQDIPYILAQYPNPKARPLVVGSQSAHDLIMRYTRGVGIKWVDAIGGLQDSHTKILAFSSGKKSCMQKPGNIFCEVGTFGNFTITAFASDHSSYDYLGSAVLAGTVHGKPPYKGTGYKMRSNTSIGYLIEYQGLRIFFSESPIVRHSIEIGNVDILIQGIAARRDYNTISGTLASLQPEYVIPGHYDNFFKPLKEFENFDVKIAFGPVDFSRFEQFVTSFESYYVERARKRLTQNTHSFKPKLRLMKLFYYYSLVNLL